MFATIDDFKTHIYAYQLGQISEGDDDIILRALLAGEEEVKAYFYINHKKEYLDGRLHYDVDKIFSASATERNPLILNIVLTVSLWHFIMLCNADIIHEHIKERYDRAIDWLTKLNKGQISLGNLPLKEEKSSGENKDKIESFIYGSRPKFNHE